MKAADPVPVAFSEIHVANALYAFISVNPYSIPSSVINLSPAKNLIVSKSLFDDFRYLIYNVLFLSPVETLLIVGTSINFFLTKLKSKP